MCRITLAPTGPVTGPEIGLHSEVRAQVNLAHGFVIDDLGRVPAGQYRAFADDVGAVTDAQRFAHVVVGNQHTNIAAFQKLYDALNFNHGDRVHPGKGFVQQNKTGVAGERAGNLYAAALATRQGQGGVLSDVRNLQLADQGFQALVDIVLADAATVIVQLQLQHGADVFFDRQSAKDGGILGQIGQAQARPLVHGHGSNGRAINFNTACIGGHNAHNHIEAGGFASPVRA